MLQFSRAYRLITKIDFQSVFAKAQKIVYKNFLVLYKPNAKSHARLGIIVKKSVIKRAVSRNTHRRWVRESFRHHAATLKALDIVVLIRSECALRKPDFQKELTDLWQKLSN